MQLPCEFLLFEGLSHYSLLSHFTRLPAPAVHSQTHSDQLHVINLAIGYLALFCQLVDIVLNPALETLLFDAFKSLTTFASAA
jgi:hypothetical protein